MGCGPSKDNAVQYDEKSAAASRGATAPHEAASGSAGAAEGSRAGAPPGTAPVEDPSVEFTGAPIPQNEDERMGALLSCNMLDTEPEGRFDDVTKLCTMIFKVPIALVSLVDSDRQWFKSVQGLDATQTDRRSSFCAWTLLPTHPEALVVPNALQDARFRHNPLVTGPPDIRFYAGCPLVCSNGQRLGSLCIIDRVPRNFDAESCQMLANLAEIVVRELEKDALMEMHTHTMQRRSQPAPSPPPSLPRESRFEEAIMLLHTAGTEWRILYVNEAWEREVGCPSSAALDAPFWRVFALPGGGGDHASYARAAEQQQSFELSVVWVGGSGGGGVGDFGGGGGVGGGGGGVSVAAKKLRPKRWLFRCANTTGMDAYTTLIGIPGYITSSENAPGYYFVTAALSPHAAAGAGAGKAEPPGSALSRTSASGGSGSGGTLLSSGGANASAAFALLPKVDPFTDIQLGPILGKGAFGRVYRGTWNGECVAVKVVEYSLQPDEVATGPNSQRKDMQLEALLQTEVMHPHVVRTYKYATRAMPTRQVESFEGEQELILREAWLVMEFCNKGSISDAVEKGWFRTRFSGGFEADLRAVLPTMRDVSSALAFLHSKGVVHGDLTGTNVLLDSDAASPRGFIAKVSDFGLSRLVDSGEGFIQTRTCGTITNMPPELLLEGQLSTAADVFSFGVLLWEMLMGRRPYAGMTHGQVLHAVTVGKGLELPQHVQPELQTLVRRCLARTPEERPTMAEIVVEVDRLEALLCPREVYSNGGGLGNSSRLQDL